MNRPKKAEMRRPKFAVGLLLVTALQLPLVPLVSTPTSAAQQEDD